MNLDQLLMLDAIVEGGSIQAASEILHKTQPAVSIGIKNLEESLGIQLLCRENYRASLTEVGKAFYVKARGLLDQVRGLQKLAQHLSQGNEPEIRIAIDGKMPLPLTLRVLRDFFSRYPQTRLNLFFENVEGAELRLKREEVDLAFTWIETFDPRYEILLLGTVQMFPVASPKLDLLKCRQPLGLEDLQCYTQVILRSSIEAEVSKLYGIVEGANQWRVNDYTTKKEIILAGLGWGTLPDHMIKKELKQGRLVVLNITTLAHQRKKSAPFNLCAIRSAHLPRGPIAEALWDFLQKTLSSKSGDLVQPKIARVTGKGKKVRG